MVRRIAWGVFRELAHSPGRETDDAEILRAAGASLAAEGFTVSFRTPDELPAPGEAGKEGPSLLFVMCERREALERLKAWERAGALIVNSPLAVENTYRDLTIGLFERAAVELPPSSLVSTTGPVPAAAFPVWVKRADVHATQEGDVVRADGAAALGAALAAFAARGIARAVVQRHAPGDLVKFYGVGRDAEGGEAPWFQWFYHRNQTLAGHVFDPEALRKAAFRAASALGVEVFGGDAIAGEGGRLSIIDLNAWPSFALYRAEAAPRIARHLAARFHALAGVSR